MVGIARIYDAAGKDDGWRVLVDRLWPRGVKKEKARVDEWMKEVAPSDELRKWFGHQAERWAEFERRYRAELAKKKELIQMLAAMEKSTARSPCFLARRTANTIRPLYCVRY